MEKIIDRNTEGLNFRGIHEEMSSFFSWTQDNRRRSCPWSEWVDC